MIETLYKTEMPEKEKSECYVLVLTSRPASERKVYMFMMEHGYWDDRVGRFHYEVTSICTESDLTQQEALAMYNLEKKKLARRGFIHTFVSDFDRKKPHEYQLLELETMSA
jgi:hypothetical protein